MVLFICTGNTCRSPMAEGLARKLFDGVAFASRGTAACGGNPPSPYAALTMMTQYGVDINGHKSKPLTKNDVEAAELLVAMTDSHKVYISGLYPAAMDKTFLLSELAGESFDIDDPISGGLSEYARCAEEIKDCLEAIDFYNLLGLSDGYGPAAR